MKSPFSLMYTNIKQLMQSMTQGKRTSYWSEGEKNFYAKPESILCCIFDFPKNSCNPISLYIAIADCLSFMIPVLRNASAAAALG